MPTHFHVFYENLDTNDLDKRIYNVTEVDCYYSAVSLLSMIQEGYTSSFFMIRRYYPTELEVSVSSSGRKLHKFYCKEVDGHSCEDYVAHSHEWLSRVVFQEE